MEFWSENARRLSPYTPGEQPRIEGLVKLNTNECPLPPSPRALEAMREAANDSLRLYPDPESRRLARDAGAPITACAPKTSSSATARTKCWRIRSSRC